MILTAENYYTREADLEYMSVSQYKGFMRCEAAALATIKREWAQPMSTALLVGSYVDAHFEGTLEQFKENHPELFKRDGTLKADYKQAEEIIQVLEDDPVFMKYMGGEKQVIRTAKLFGVPWKIKIDADHDDMIVDLKIMRSMERVMGRSFVEHWGYDIQMAVYQAVSAAAGYPREETHLAVGTKQTPPDKEIVEIPPWRRNECLEEVEKNLPRIMAVKRGEVEARRCGTCDYCRATKKLKMPLDFELVGLSNAELVALMGTS